MTYTQLLRKILIISYLKEMTQQEHSSEDYDKYSTLIKSMNTIKNYLLNISQSLHRRTLYL